MLMKSARKYKLLFIIVTLLFISCSTSITSPLTSIKYTGTISEEGISVNVLLPFWSWCVEAYQYLVTL